jgi:predicted O-methyltransferase YrrM
MRILEIGTGAGDVTLHLAKFVGDHGVLLTMEADAASAASARQRFARAGLATTINVIVGEPVRFLHKVRGPFDVIVVNDRDIPRDKVMRLLAPGGGVVMNHATIMVNDMTIAEWLAQAKADAEKRGLPELLPMLDGLAQATERLRAADWNDNPDQDSPANDNDQ